MSEIKPLARKADIVVQNLEDETLVYDLTINKAFALNETSALVWQLCDGQHSISDISNKLSVKLNDLVTEDLVWLSLEQLKKENLLENDSILSLPFKGFSRREVIRKIGFASMVTLPIISSLVAPFAVNAASLCFPTTNNNNENQNGCTCDTLDDCISNCCSFANPRVCMPSRSGSLVIAPCQPCNSNCQCPTMYNCPSIMGRPRICRPNGVSVPPLPTADNCV